MSWVYNQNLSFMEKLGINVTRCGPIPKHIAFIMDGNRRYATKMRVQQAIGHTKGFDKLTEVLYWCAELGVPEVTVYAFSIENFKRSPEEVDTLMQLAMNKYKRLLEELTLFEQNGICVRVVGNFNLIPKELRQIMSEAILATKNNKHAVLNVAFAYTSRDEITESIKIISDAVKQGKIEKDDISQYLISECMYSAGSLKPDMLIRTSGEVRFSDFLLWQCNNNNVIFTKVLWPELKLWHLLAAIFKFQRSYGEIQSLHEKLEGNYEANPRVTEFIEKLREEKLRKLNEYAIIAS